MARAPTAEIGHIREHDRAVQFLMAHEFLNCADALAFLLQRVARQDEKEERIEV
jgi:hypothetical protein